MKENLASSLLTNRWLKFREQINGPRTKDYPSGIVVLNVGKDGNGTGAFAPLSKIRFNKKKELEIEEFGQKPFRLANAAGEVGDRGTSRLEAVKKSIDRIFRLIKNVSGDPDCRLYAL